MFLAGDKPQEIKKLSISTGLRPHSYTRILGRYTWPLQKWWTMYSVSVCIYIYMYMYMYIDCVYHIIYIYIYIHNLTATYCSYQQKCRTNSSSTRTCHSLHHFCNIINQHQRPSLHGKPRDGTAIHQTIKVHIFGPAQLGLLLSDLMKWKVENKWPKEMGCSWNIIWWCINK